jgi:D-serine deaminase-like pyridoxal phosphate-dependent protein
MIDVVTRVVADELVGKLVREVDTPVPLLDLDAFERNAIAISSLLSEHGLAWRPHTKAHKSPRLAHLQATCGAAGVTCAKLSEAEVMVAGGIHEVLVANHLGTRGKWDRAAALQRDANVIVCVDDPQHVEMASSAGVDAGAIVPLLIEVDIGMQRVGVTSSDAAVRLAAQIARAPGVRLDGVMGYEGHLLTVWPQPEKAARCAEALATLTDIADRLRQIGHTVEIVSSGGTGSFESTAHLPGLTESQAGGGCLMDRFYAEDCHVELTHALTLAATIVSVQAEDRAIMDAGFKALGRGVGFALPRVLDQSGVDVVALSAEHGILDVHAAAQLLRVGDQLRLVPGYSDAMMVLHDHLIGHREGRVTEVILMPGRGRLT